ncbi:LytTR family DNA-binding domain-containing protein [Rasiella sp. SM2506]|uniref:LytTR family DNA-binding domain-containing protein n=1 Tax=Rasiella sp. SM2506 TaxID=3423914 RepID=UPI003D790790
MLKKLFPFDPLLKHHLLVALGLAVWIFLFLALTEPLDTNEFDGTEKLLYLPLYGIAGATAYLLILPLQNFLYSKNEHQWMLWNEVVFFLLMTLFGLVLSRFIYLYVIVPGAQNPYTLYYFTTSLYLPAIATILPILAIGRWAAGRYFEKKLEDQKIEIEGEGTYEGLRLQLNDLVSIKADDNYIEVSFLNNGKLKKQLIRNKLSSVETCIPDLLRTHRSYLINPNHFQQFKMDSGKLNLVLSSEIIIPVSKTYSETIKEQLGI